MTQREKFARILKNTLSKMILQLNKCNTQFFCLRLWSFLTLYSGISMSSGFRGLILSRCSGGRVFSGGCSSGPISIFGWSAGSSGRGRPGETCFSELSSSSDKDSTLHFKFFFYFLHFFTSL